MSHSLASDDDMHLILSDIFYLASENVIELFEFWGLQYRRKLQHISVDIPCMSVSMSLAGLSSAAATSRALS